MQALSKRSRLYEGEASGRAALEKNGESGYYVSRKMECHARLETEIRGNRIEKKTEEDARFLLKSGWRLCLADTVIKSRLEGQKLKLQIEVLWLGAVWFDDEVEDGVVAGNQIEILVVGGSKREGWSLNRNCESYRHSGNSLVSNIL
ncbi:unnamed protein product [Arabidopsis halleri]